MENLVKNKVTITATRIAVRAENRKEFFQTIAPLTDRIRKENGCLAFRIYEETGDEDCLILMSEWLTERNWENHRNGDTFAVLHGLVTVLSVPSKLDFRLLSQIGGIETMTNS